jgi:alpha-ketoglutarate-dependent taurine dioxygenase
VLDVFSAEGNRSGALLLRGYRPAADLPLTPPFSRPEVGDAADLGQFAQCVVAATLGDPVCYAEEKRGALFHDVSPTRTNQDAVSSQSSRTGLEFHTEMVFHPLAPEFLLLLALRQDPQQTALTSFSCTRNFLDDLDPTALAQLARRDYRIALEKLHSPYQSAGTPISEVALGPPFSVLSNSGTDPRIRFEPELTVSATEDAAAALRALAAAIHRHQVSIALEPGDLLLLDNRYCVHARSSFQAAYDGTDRWLRRLLVRRDLPVGGRRISVDLVEGWAA